MSHAPNSIAARDIAYTLHGYTNMEVHEQKGPVVMARGDGIRVYDDEGRVRNHAESLAEDLRRELAAG